MRWLVAVSLLTVLLPVPTGAQDSPALLEDPTGDATFTVQDAEVPAQPWPQLDLLALDWGEFSDRFTLDLHVARLDSDRPEVISADTLSYQVRFDHGDKTYQVSFTRFVGLPGDGASYNGYLSQYEPATDRYAFIEDLEVEANVPEATLTTSVPKALILDADGKQPTLGDTLMDIHAISRASAPALASILTEEVSSDASDRMPDDGAATWDVEYGIEQSGHIRIDSPRPTRASNGEATTFIFETTVQNQADAPDTVRLSAGELPTNWVVTFPQERVRIEAQSEVEVPVLVTVPFAHDHGSFQSVLVEAQSQSDPEGVGRIELGVRYTAVPQPAGHHDRLWIHSDGSQLYVNTMEDHAGNTGEPIGVTGEGGSFVTNTYRWTAPLLPGLEMGLDFDTQRSGRLDVTVEMPAGGLSATIDGSLRLQRGGEDFIFENDDTVLATFASEPIDFMPGDRHTFEVDMEPTAESDKVPLEEDTNLVLAIALTATSPFGTSLTPLDPKIVPGTSMQLPLEEYHDEVSGYFSTLSGIDLYATGGQERLVNAGEAAVFSVEAENLDDERASFDLRLSGTNAQWARILGPASLSLDAGARTQLQVAVMVPADASDGERADVTLHAERRDDPNVRSLVRLLVEVDDDEDHEDQAAVVEAFQGTADKESPALGLLALLGVVVAVRARRQ